MERQSPELAAALLLAPPDSVVIALGDVGPGTSVDFEEGAVSVREFVPQGHKIAIRDIRAGAFVLKYGEPIGVAVTDISAGQHVHVHNLRSARAAI